MVRSHNYLEYQDRVIRHMIVALPNLFVKRPLFDDATMFEPMQITI
jgi:hypothetical protein